MRITTDSWEPWAFAGSEPGTGFIMNAPGGTKYALGVYCATGRWRIGVGGMEPTFINAPIGTTLEEAKALAIVRHRMGD